MGVDDVRRQTAALLKVNEAELSYITQELLDEYEANAKAVEGSDVDPEAKFTLTNWGTYGNSIAFSGALVYWKQNKKGTPNYGCGTAESWSAGKDWCTWIIPKGKCTDGKDWKFIGNYQG